MNQARQEKPKRERGTGSIYEHRGVWHVQVRDQGKRLRESTGLRGKEGEKAAKNLLKKRLGEIAVGRFRPGADRVRLADLKRLVEVDYDLNTRRSVERVRQSYMHLERFFGTMPAPLIPRRASEYIATRREEGAKNSTIRNEITALRRGFTLAVREGLLVDRPVFPSIRVTTVRQGFVDDKVMAKILAALPEHAAPFAEFCFRTAWRRGEVQGLLWSDVDADAGEIRIPGARTKNGRPATFPFSADARLSELLKEQRARTDVWQRERGELVPWVFWRGTKSGARPLRGCWKSWATATKAAGAPGLLLHDLRRSRARLWSNRGVPDRVGMALGHWATRSVYDRYGIVSDADMREGVGRSEREESATHSPRRAGPRG